MKNIFTVIKSNSRFLNILILVFAVSSSTLFGQMAYTDIIPDAELISYDSIYLDINKDGINDYTLFYKNYAGSQYYHYHVTISPNNGSAIAIVNDSASALMLNETIDEQLEWSTNKTYIQYIEKGGPDRFLGNWINIREGYLGLRLSINNEFHYAWLRMHQSEDFVMWAVDFALNETPQQAAIAGQELPVFATSVLASDEHEYFDGRDIVVSFTKASEEALFSEYRIIIAKADDSTAEDIMVMSQLSEDKYYSINIIPADTNFTEIRSLRETTVDKDGDLIEKFINYKAYILNVSANGNFADNQLSVASPIFNIQGYVHAVNTPTAYDNENYSNSSDITVSFNTNIDRDYLKEFRAFIVPSEDIADFNAQIAWSLNNDFYTRIQLQDDTIAVLSLNENQKDISGNIIRESIPYDIMILSVADSIDSYRSVLSPPSRKFFLRNPSNFTAGQKEGNYTHWFECDSAFSPYPYWNGSNQFHGSAEFYIDMNRDGLVDFEIYGTSYSSSGGSVGRYFELSPLRENKVLICDHEEHENWIDVLQEKDAIGAAYNWHDSTSILKRYYSGGGSGVTRNDGHLSSPFYHQDYYIGFIIMDNGYPQYAWLKMHGAKFIEYAFTDIYNSTTDFTKEKLFNVFPNPANNFIQIQSSTDLFASQNISISIINSLGIVVDEFDLNKRSLSKDISSYPTGLYFFVIKDDNGILETHRIIIE